MRAVIPSKPGDQAYKEKKDKSILCLRSAHKQRYNN